MSKHKKNIESEAAASQNGEAFAATAPNEAGTTEAGTSSAEAPKQKRRLGGWAITGIAAAGLVLLAGTAGAGAVAGIAASHAIGGERSEHESAEASQFGGEHRDHDDEFGEMRDHDDEYGEHRDHDDELGEMRQRSGDRMQGQTPPAPEGQQGQMQRPYMNGQTGAS